MDEPRTSGPFLLRIVGAGARARLLLAGLALVPGALEPAMATGAPALGEPAPVALTDGVVPGGALEHPAALAPFFTAAAPAHAPPAPPASDRAFLQELGRAHFRYFEAQSEPATGLTRDRSQAASPASIAAVGFSLTAHPVAVKNGWMRREAAAAYTLRVLRTLEAARQGPEAEGTAGHKGFFYHFLDREAATRVWKCELSTIDTALLMAGVIFCRNYYDGPGSAETEIRERATRLYNGVDWAWALDGGDRVSLGWHPEKGFLPYQWGAYNEAMIMMLLGLGSPTHPLPAATWAAYTKGARVAERYGQRYLYFGPMFGHQYSHAWVDFRGIKDGPTAHLGFDYFENSRRAALAQRAYATANPGGWRGYGPLDWGLTACDGPGGGKKMVAGREREFFDYMARGAPDDHDDGTIAPTAAAASLPFVPEAVLPTLRHWRRDRPEIWGPYGFQDAFNPTFDPTKPSGWVGPDTLGIDQGPIVLMIENHLSGFVWDVMKKDPDLRRGLEQAGFKGEWGHRGMLGAAGVPEGGSRQALGPPEGASPPRHSGARVAGVSRSGRGTEGRRPVQRSHRLHPASGHLPLPPSPPRGSGPDGLDAVDAR